MVEKIPAPIMAAMPRPVRSRTVRWRARPPPPWPSASAGGLARIDSMVLRRKSEELAGGIWPRKNWSGKIANGQVTASPCAIGEGSASERKAIPSF
uniref:Uncharacterized protein n=1 Tax=Tanacetum cinerariifolium TaxID=118510 RepID=A0A699X109_TANCI|nr:hypothetical protein [Tanacetum cinerariifolium]